MTPEIVLKASGHVERFTDFMVRRRRGRGAEPRAAADARSTCDPPPPLRLPASLNATAAAPRHNAT